MSFPEIFHSILEDWSHSVIPDITDVWDNYCPSFASYHRLAREGDWEHGSCLVPAVAGPPGFVPGSNLL